MNATTGIGIENKDGIQGIALTGIANHQAFKLTPRFLSRSDNKKGERNTVPLALE